MQSSSPCTPSVEIGRLAGDDTLVHAVLRTRAGDAAVCGGGPIVTPVWGTFSPGGQSCTECARRLDYLQTG